MDWILDKAGRVRQLYARHDEVAIVAGNDISIGNKVIKSHIPERGEILTAFSTFWFEKISGSIPSAYLNSNGYTEWPPEVNPKCCIRMKKLRMLPIEAVVRGYLAGDAWHSYYFRNRHTNCYRFCGNIMPPGLLQSDKLPKPIFTPTTKASREYSSRRLTFDQMVSYLMSELKGDFSSAKIQEFAEQIREYSLKLYNIAQKYAENKGLIIADTKFEFGIDEETGKLLLGDELLTPDSSRYWPIANYKIGREQTGFDKERVRRFVKEHPEATEFDPLLADDLYRRYLDCLLMLQGCSWRQNGNLGLSGVKIHTNINSLPKAI